MKKMRKLIPAFAMLMVAAVMMSTASFAWFTMSKTVTASGMKVQATTSGGLAIAYATSADNAKGYDAPSPDAFKSSVDLANGGWTNGATKINPTSVSINGATWFKAYAGTAESSTAAANTYATVTENLDQYYFKTALYVRSLAESSDTTPVDLFVKEVNVTTAATDSQKGSDLEKALRVAINVGDKWLFFAPNYAAGTTGLKYVASVSGNAGTPGTYNATQMFTGQNALTGAELVTDGVAYSNNTEVVVYIYFEGEDPNCKSSLAFNLRDLSVEVIFSTENTSSGT